MCNLFEQADELVENTNNSPDGYEYDLRFDIADFIYDKLKDLGKKKKWLAEKLNMKQSQLSRILCTSENLTLNTVARIFWALGEEPTIIKKNSLEDSINFTGSGAQFSSDFAGSSSNIVESKSAFSSAKSELITSK